MPAELLCLSLFGVEGLLGFLQLIYDLLGLFHFHSQLIVLLCQLLVLPAELHHQLAQLLVLLATVHLELLHLHQRRLHALHQALKLVLRHPSRCFLSSFNNFVGFACLEVQTREECGTVVSVL